MTMIIDDMFETENTCYNIAIPDGHLDLYPNFLSSRNANNYFMSFLNNIDWKQEKITVYGKTHAIPRLSAWYADAGQSYEYSGLRVEGKKWLPELLEIKEKIEVLTGELFNSVLVNHYRSGSDGVGWHSDDEPELGKDPIIASVSLGEVRTLQIKNKKDKTCRESILLPHGSLLMMGKKTQQHWYHQIPKSKKQLDSRINLTYRLVNQ